MRADEALPDDMNHASFNGVSVRKGTVAAFIASARVFVDPSTPEADRARARQDILDAAPALHALGLLDVMAVKDERVRALVQPDAPPR